jgi:glucosamine 6-phosphate synthetase-like amidotransferase/phosphosugar isomerase protein
MPVIIIMTRDSLYPKVQSALAQITARKGQPIIICCENDPTLQQTRWRKIVVPASVDCLQGILNIIPLQLLSYHLAIMNGFDVDFPRNLYVHFVLRGLYRIQRIWRDYLLVADRDFADALLTCRAKSVTVE